MIISRTPVRIALGGGGTDLPSYYERFGASLVTATIDKYVYILVKQRFNRDIRVSYAKTEIVSTVEEVQHPVVREALRLLRIDGGIEIVSVADVPANAGLGTSSSFAVGLLNALHAYKGEHPTADVLAREAYVIERVILKEAGGLQDQYVAAHGGLIVIDVTTKGEITVRPLPVEPRGVAELESRLLFFNTQLTRTASEIQAEHVTSMVSGSVPVLESLHTIKRLGVETREALERADLDRFGRLLHEHWHQKKQVGSNISNPSIDRWYDLAIGAGALGGKLIGAGGGGFLMFCCDQPHRDRVREALAHEGLDEVRFRFEPSGSRILVNF